MSLPFEKGSSKGNDAICTIVQAQGTLEVLWLVMMHVTMTSWEGRVKWRRHMKVWAVDLPV